MPSRTSDDLHLSALCGLSAPALVEGQGSAVADLAGAFGAELVRAIRASLAQDASPMNGPRGPSRIEGLLNSYDQPPEPDVA